MSRPICACFLPALLALTACAVSALDAAPASIARGVVFHDQNGDGIHQPGERLLSGIAVSNGRDVVLTGADGRYELPVGDHTIIFVIKPSGWMVPVDENQIPRFYHVHSPRGGPGGRHPGLPPTGPLPARIDFPLHPQVEPDSFDVLVFGDTQPRNLDEIHYLAHDSLQELTGAPAAFGVTLGDIVFDDLSIMEDLNSAVATIGIPWRHVIGNHDLDYRAGNHPGVRGDYHRVYGPSWYSFSHGPAHFIALDNIRWLENDRDRRYRTGLGADQLAFLKHELERIPADQLVVLMAHIPWVGSTAWADPAERAAFLALIAARPNTISLVSHAHRHYHHLLASEHGWPPGQHHHMVVVGAVCGSWWRGAHDVYGIPHAMMTCGTPTGYAFLSIAGADWKLRYQAARRPASFQMHLHAPDSVARGAADIAIYANIFNALPDAQVRMRVGRAGVWQPMARSAEEDPVFLAAAQREAAIANPQGRRMRDPRPSPHLWKAGLPTNLPPGFHVIEVHAKDAWHEHHGRRLIRIH